jgi:hypothetical protein
MLQRRTAIALLHDGCAMIMNVVGLQLHAYLNVGVFMMLLGPESKVAML